MSEEIVKLNEAGGGRVLFLGYSREQTRLIDELIERGCQVSYTLGPIQTTEGFDLVVSFGYRHILTKAVIESSDAPIVNLHIAYLPFNRGAHPSFWSFFEGTPSGVTIHLIDEGIDTGPILFRKCVEFDPDELTFAQAYDVLIEEIQDLFMERVDAIIEESFTPRAQRGRGSYHKVADLPKEFGGWDTRIGDEIRRLDGILGGEIERRLAIVDEIERVRKSNNVNWMDLLRLAIRSSPDASKKLIRRINQDDRRISDLLENLGQ